MFRVFRRIMWRNFSAATTAWRSERDSNSRYRFAVLSLDVSVSYRLQKHPQRIPHQKLDLRALQSVRFRFAVHSDWKANAKRFCGRKRSFCPALGSFIRFACDCVPGGQSRDRNFLQRKELLGAEIPSNFRLSCPHFLGRYCSTFHKPTCGPEFWRLAVF
jgi:hypothetical protein